MDQPELLWNAILGWTGLDQYDEANPVGQQFLDDYRGRYGRRPEYCVPVVNRDFATVLLHAFADAHPLTPAGSRKRSSGSRCCRRHRAHPAPASRSASGPTGAGWAPATSSLGRSIPTVGVSRLVDRFGED